MQKTIQYIKTELAAYYPDTEISGFVRLLSESVLDMSYTDMILKKDRIVSAEEIDTITEIVDRVITSYSIHYTKLYEGCVQAVQLPLTRKEMFVGVADPRRDGSAKGPRG